MSITKIGLEKSIMDSRSEGVASQIDELAEQTFKFQSWQDLEKQIESAKTHFQKILNAVITPVKEIPKELQTALKNWVDLIEFGQLQVAIDDLEAIENSNAISQAENTKRMEFLLREV